MPVAMPAQRLPHAQCDIIAGARDKSMGFVAARVRNAPTLIGVLSFISSVAMIQARNMIRPRPPQSLVDMQIHRQRTLREQKQNKASKVQETKKHRP
jgi:hypothetical protein